MTTIAAEALTEAFEAHASDRTPLISVKGIRKTYLAEGGEFEALRGVDLEIMPGEFVSITGESGSGKSTMLSVLGAVTPPTSGALTVDGIDIGALDHERTADFRREYIGFIFQQFHLVAYLTALENVMLPLVITGRSSKEMREMAMASLANVGLGAKHSRLPSELSGGEQQRVAVARALVNEPPLILADEPTGNLDTHTGEEIFNLLTSLNKAGKTLVLVTHNPALALRTKRAIRMRDGLITSDTKNG